MNNMNSIEFEKSKWTPGDIPLLYSRKYLYNRALGNSFGGFNEEANQAASQFIFSDRGRELNAIINDNQGQMSANALMREVFLAGYIQGRLLS